MAGGRAFTATSSYGLVYMYDAMFNTAGYRAPVVMINVNREPPGIHAVCSGQQDMISVRDTGWVQLIVENDQEIMDTTIMAFRLAEDYDIQLPVIVNYDGYYLSFLAESVEIPAITAGGRLPGGAQDPAAAAAAAARLQPGLRQPRHRHGLRGAAQEAHGGHGARQAQARGDRG